MQLGYLLLSAGWLVFMRQHLGGRREEEATLHFVCLALRAGCILTKLYVPSILWRPQPPPSQILIHFAAA